MDVSLVFITVLLEDGGKSHQTPEYALIEPKCGKQSVILTGS